MLKKITILVFALAGCCADTRVPNQGVYCSYVPVNLHSCMGSPRIVSNEVTKKCKNPGTPCNKMTCLVTESGWLQNGKVDKKKVSEYFDAYATSQPVWSAAVAHLKAACLGDRNLPAQGHDVNCPSYDLMHCILISFIRNISPSQWRSAAECNDSRAYASSCPICPDECFAPQVPNDSCHACLSLPRSA